MDALLVVLGMLLGALLIWLPVNISLQVLKILLCLDDLTDLEK